QREVYSQEAHAEQLHQRGVKPEHSRSVVVQKVSVGHFAVQHAFGWRDVVAQNREAESSPHKKATAQTRQQHRNNKWNNVEEQVLPRWLRDIRWIRRWIVRSRVQHVKARVCGCRHHWECTDRTCRSARRPISPKALAKPPS